MKNIFSKINLIVVLIGAILSLTAFAEGDVNHAAGTQGAAAKDVDACKACTAQATDAQRTPCDPTVKGAQACAPVIQKSEDANAAKGKTTK